MTRASRGNTSVAVHLRKLALDQILRFERFCGLKVASGQNELDQAVAAVIVRDQLMTQDFKCVGHGAACHRGLLLLGESSCTKMPCVGALLRQPGFGLKFPGTVRDTFISPTLSFHQALGSLSLKQAGSLNTDGACVRMGSYVFDHGWPYEAPVLSIG